MSRMKLFEALVNDLLISTNVARTFALKVARLLDPTLKINTETIYLFNFQISLRILSTFKSKLNHLLLESQELQELIHNNIY